MKLDLNGILYALSYALDCEERELVGVSADHAKWVAFVSASMGSIAHLTREQQVDLAACGILHDNALTQYIAEEQPGNEVINLGSHCSYGEKNIKKFPFRTDMSGAVLFHHENADGTGPFGRMAEETPLSAQIIHLADYVDKDCGFRNIGKENYRLIAEYLKKQTGTVFSEEVCSLYFKAVSEERYLSWKDKTIDELLSEMVPSEEREYTFSEIKNMMDVFAKIVDYKSVFTSRHSTQITDRVYKMAQYYQYDEWTCERLYIAGALHDIGKMAIGNDILEKPDKLSDKEFVNMKNHAWYTYQILSRIKNAEDITSYASLHHEKLNGKGYPFGKTAEELGEKERLMACIDIYQALREDRPYKAGMTHQDAMKIMQNMVNQGFIDSKITEDINCVFAE